jgi:SAM-dependent methyltransferase
MQLLTALRPLWSRIAPPSSDVRRREREIRKIGPAQRWQGLQREEVGFWDNLLGSAQMPRLSRNRPLQPHLMELLAATTSHVEILDVGAGPATIVGDEWPGRQVHITALDANAADFDRLLDKYGIAPPCRTRFGYVEDLASVVPMAFFDLVHARNCIDHCKDPLSAIDQMVQAVKPGCCVFLNHYVSEGRRNGYAGPHQWNLFPRNGRFYVDCPSIEPVDIGKRLEHVADVYVGPPLMGPESFTVVIRRHVARGDS